MSRRQQVEPGVIDYIPSTIDAPDAPAPQPQPQPKKK
jgi:hypothetical protein